MAFWKIKFGKKKINLFKDVCMFMLTESANKSFLLTLSSCLVFMIVATACRVNERVCRVFLLNVVRDHLKLDHEL